MLRTMALETETPGWISSNILSLSFSRDWDFRQFLTNTKGLYFNHVLGFVILPQGRSAWSYLAVTASQIQHHLGSTLSSKVLRSAHLGRLTGFACKSFSIVNPRGQQLKALCRQLRVWNFFLEFETVESN